MLVLFYSDCREFYKTKIGDDVKALPSQDSPGFKARYKRVSRACFGRGLLIFLSLKSPGSHRG